MYVIFQQGWKEHHMVEFVCLQVHSRKVEQLKHELAEQVSSLEAQLRTTPSAKPHAEDGVESLRHQMQQVATQQQLRVDEAKKETLAQKQQLVLELAKKKHLQREVSC